MASAANVAIFLPSYEFFWLKVAPIIPDICQRFETFIFCHLGGFLPEGERIGPRRVAKFLYGRPDPETQADAMGIVRQLLESCAR